MRRATHAKFGTGVVVAQRREGGEDVVVVAFPDVGQKKLAARFVALEDAQDPEPPRLEEQRSRELEAAIAANRDDVRAYRAYGQWLAERGEPHGELVLRECEPPSAAAKRAKRETHERDVERLRKAALAPLRAFTARSSPRVTCTFARGFVDRVDVVPRTVGELVAIVRALHAARVTAFLRTLHIDLPMDGGDLEPLWRAWTTTGRFPHVTMLVIPSPGARGAALGDVLDRVELLSVKRAHDLRLPPLPRVRAVQLVDPSSESIADLCSGAPFLQRLDIAGEELRGDVLRVLAEHGAALRSTHVTVTAARVDGLDTDEVRAIREALPRASLSFPGIWEAQRAQRASRRPRAAPARRVERLDLEIAMIDGDPRPFARVIEAVCGGDASAALVVRTADEALVVVTGDGRAVAADGRNATLPEDDDDVVVVHPADLDDGTTGKLARVLDALGRTQPLEQVARKVFRLAPHRAPLTVHPLDALSERSVRALWKRRWYGDFDEDAWDAVAIATLRDFFSAARVVARVPHAPVYRARGGLLDDGGVGPCEEPALTFFAEGEPIPLGTVPARVYSEVMRDLAAVAPEKRAKTARRATRITAPARVDRLFDRLVRVADDVDVRADLNAAIGKLPADAQRLVALVVQGKVASDAALPGALGVAPDVADALLAQVEETVRDATAAADGS